MNASVRKDAPGSGLGSDVSRARSFRRWLFVEADALTFVQLLEPTRRHRAAVKEPLLAAIVANEAESAIPNQPFNRAVRHVDVPPQAIDGSPYGYAIKFHSTIRSTWLKFEHTPPRGKRLELTSGWLECEDPLRRCRRERSVSGQHEACNGAPPDEPRVRNGKLADIATVQ